MNAYTTLKKRLKQTCKYEIIVYYVFLVDLSVVWVVVFLLPYMRNEVGVVRRLENIDIVL